MQRFGQSPDASTPSDEFGRYFFLAPPEGAAVYLYVNYSFLEQFTQQIWTVSIGEDGNLTLHESSGASTHYTEGPGRPAWVGADWTPPAIELDADGAELLARLVGTWSLDVALSIERTGSDEVLPPDLEMTMSFAARGADGFGVVTQAVNVPTADTSHSYVSTWALLEAPSADGAIQIRVHTIENSDFQSYLHAIVEFEGPDTYCSVDADFPEVKLCFRRQGP